MTLPLHLSAIIISCRARLAFLLVAGTAMILVLASNARADATDISLLFVKKSQLYRQVDGSSPTLQSNPFTFQAGANPTGANRITSAQFAPPTPSGTPGAPIAMTDIGSGTFFFDGGRFATQAALDAAFPNGTYAFSLQTVTGTPTYNDTVTTGNVYPTNTPRQQNGTWSNGGLQVDATKAYTFNWNDVSPTTGTQMVFEIRDASGAIVFTVTRPPDPSGFAINVTIPANTLQAGAYYTANLAFQRRVATTVSPTFTKVSIYSTEETFKIATIGAIPTLNGPSNPMGTVGQMFIYQIIASDHPFSYSADGDLPPGLTLDNSLGIISGVPTATSATQITLNATNINGTGTQPNFVPAIQAAPTSGPIIVSSTCAQYYMGQPFSFQVATKGATSAARITATGLPAGLSLDPVTGVISGTAASVGSFPVNLTVTDGSFTVAGFLQLTFTADPAYPVITNADKVTVPRGQTFNYKIATPGASDPADPPTFTIIGNLPPGLGFDPATATISGTYSGPLQRSMSSNDGGGGPPVVKELSGGALLGSVQLFGTNSHGTSTFQLLFLAPPSGAVNIATRLFVGTGENVLIGGFIVTGNAPKVVIVRAIGPSTGIPGALQDPILQLRNEQTQAVVTNDNWRDTQEQLIKDTTIPPNDDRESAIVAGLDPGNYTAIVSGKDGGTGIGLVEVYDLGTASLDTTSKAQLAEISTRGNVLTADNVIIGGFIISGVNTKVLVRGIGPSLTAFGIGNALQDPTIELHDGNGATIGTNDDWRSDQEQAIINTSVPPKDDRESAIVSTLSPGAYTAILRGKSNTTGVALVEVYGLQ
jgi:hypothetical protein